MEYRYYKDVHQKTEPDTITFDTVNFLLKDIEKVYYEEMTLSNGNRGMFISWKNRTELPTIIVDEGIKA